MEGRLARSGIRKKLLPAASLNCGLVGRFPQIALFTSVFVVASLLHVSCRRGQLEGTTYEKPGLSYQIGRLSGDWRSVTIESNDLAWTHESAVIQVNGSCDPRHDVPLKALTHHLVIGFTERQVISQKRVPLDGREALRTRMEAKLDGVPRELLLVVLKKNGCAYDFALVGSMGDSFERAIRDFDGMLRGFRHIRAEG